MKTKLTQAEILAAHNVTPEESTAGLMKTRLFADMFPAVWAAGENLLSQAFPNVEDTPAFLKANANEAGMYVQTSGGTLDFLRGETGWSRVVFRPNDGREELVETEGLDENPFDVLAALLGGGSPFPG